MRTPAARAGVSDTVFARLLGRILDGHYGRAGRLPAERELAADFGASRVSIREALQRLAEWRVLRIRRGSGAAVTEAREWALGVLPAYLSHAFADGRWDVVAPLLSDALALRRFLVERAVVRLAGRLAPGSLDGARAEARAAWDSRKDHRELLRHEFEMHRAILEAGGVWPFVWLLNSIRGASLAAFPKLLASLHVPDDYLEAHLRFLDELEAGHGERALRILARYWDRHDARVDLGKSGK